MAENTDTQTTTDERTLRRAKRQAMLDAGVSPYPSRFETTTFSADLEVR